MADDWKSAWKFPWPVQVWGICLFRYVQIVGVSKSLPKGHGLAVQCSRYRLPASVGAQIHVRQPCDETFALDLFESSFPGSLIFQLGVVCVSGPNAGQVVAWSSSCQSPIVRGNSQTETGGVWSSSAIWNKLLCLHTVPKQISECGSEACDSPISLNIVPEICSQVCLHRRQQRFSFGEHRACMARDVGGMCKKVGFGVVGIPPAMLKSSTRPLRSI